MISLFKCQPFDVKLSTTACADRHRLAKNGGRTTNGGPKLVGHQRCAECSVGAAHVLGLTATAWDDGTPVEFVQVALPAPRSVPTVAPSPPLPADRRSAPRAVEPSISETPARVDPELEQTSEGERVDGEPGAGPGARAAEPTAAERPGSEGLESAAAGGAGRACSTAQAGRRGMREGKRYPWGDRNLTIAEWAREPEARKHGLSANAIKQRLRKDPSIERAVTTPKYAGCKPPKRRTADEAAPAAPAPRSNGEAIVQRLDALFVPREPAGPAVLLEAAGYRVVSSTRAPAGLVLIVEEARR